MKNTQLNQLAEVIGELSSRFQWADVDDTEFIASYKKKPYLLQSLFKWRCSKI